MSACNDDVVWNRLILVRINKYFLTTNSLRFYDFLRGFVIYKLYFMYFTSS